jgi:hypothetical protein
MVVEEAVLSLSTQEGLDRRAEMPLWLAGLFESNLTVGGVRVRGTRVVLGMIRGWVQELVQVHRWEIELSSEDG